jgi:hypothetical protein
MLCLLGILTPTRRRWRLIVADYGGQRQIRQQEFTPDPPRDPLSRDQHEYVDGVPAMQQKYANNATYNGEDAMRRLGSGP